MNKKKGLIMLGVILVIGFYLRLSPALETRDFWYDEAFTGILLKAPIGEMNDMIFRDVHPPLYYWLSKPIGSWFGYSAWGIRFFSVIFGMLTIWSIFEIGRKMFNEKIALLAAAFCAFSPFAIQYSQEARMYALFGFLMLWATWFFYQALTEGTKKNWILWGIFGGLSFYTHYLSLFFFIAFYFTYIFYRKIFDGKSFWKAVFTERNFYLGAGIIFLFFISWIKIFISHISKGNLGWIDPVDFSSLPSTIQIFLFGHPPGTGGVPSANNFRLLFDQSSFGLLVLVFSACLFTYLWNKSNSVRKPIFVLLGISLGTMVLLILLSHLNIKLYVSRYFMPAAVIFYLLFSALIISVFSSWRSWTLSLVIFLLLLINLQPIKYTTDWSHIAGLVKDEVLKTDKIIALNPFDYTSARYYFGEANVRYFNKNNPAEDFSGWVVVGNDNRLETTEKLAQYKGSLIIGDNCLKTGIDNLKLEPIVLDKLSVCRIR